MIIIISPSILSRSFLLPLPTSQPPLRHLRNRILKRIPLPKLIIIVLRFIPLIQVQIILREEMIMILGPNQLVLVSVFSLVRVKEGCLILTQLVVVVLVVEVFVCLVGALVGG